MTHAWLGQIATPLQEQLLVQIPAGTPGAAEKQRFIEAVSALSQRALAMGRIADKYELSLEPAGQNIVRHVNEMRKLAYQVASLVAKVVTQSQPAITADDRNALAKFEDELSKAEDAYAKMLPEVDREVEKIMAWLQPIGVAGGLGFITWNIVRGIKSLLGFG